MRNIINRKEDTRVQSYGVPFAPPSPIYEFHVVFTLKERLEYNMGIIFGYMNIKGKGQANSVFSKFCFHRMFSKF